MREIRRGDVVYIDLGQHIRSSVQSGVRPCIVVSNNMGNKYSSVVTVCPFTAKIKNNPVHVVVKPNDIKGYFEKISDFLPEQIVTVSKAKIENKIGIIPEDSEIMKKINAALIKQLELEVAI